MDRCSKGRRDIRRGLPHRPAGPGIGLRGIDSWSRLGSWFSAMCVFLWLAFPSSGEAASFTLAWDPNQEPDLAGYKLYYGTSSGSYQHSLDVGNVTQYTLGGLRDGVTYYFAATAYDTAGNESGYSNEVSARSNLPPVASATASPTSGHLPLEVRFQGSASDQDGSIVSYAWDFGDSAASTAQNPSHVYSSAGTYTARLTVTDNDGATASASVQVTVLPPNSPPTVRASASPASGTAPLSVAFSADSTDSDGTVVGYSWEFGDGGTSSQRNPTHVYTAPGLYTARVTVRDDDGATASASVQVSVAAANQPPVANPSASPLSGHAPLSVAFLGSGSDPDGSIAGFHWDFGDGATSSQQNPSHTYSSAGTYTAVLTVTDDKGATGSQSLQITVQPPNQPPTLDASAAPTKGAPPLVVSFTAQATDPDGRVVYLEWDLGDGTRSTEANLRHTYAAEGVYRATVQVRDDDGATQTKSFTIRVDQAPSPPKGLKVSRR